MSTVFYYYSKAVDKNQMIMSTNSELSEKQQKVLDVIVDYVQNIGRPPTIREIMSRTQILSLRGVTLQLESLEKAGHISREVGVNRGIKLNPSILSPETSKITIPLMACSIPAGTPTLADSDIDSYIKVTLLQTKGIKDVFAVKIHGLSMINAGINDGDIALVMAQSVASDGDIVAAITEDNNEVTLKKFRIVEGHPILFPANPDFSPITQPFRIQGKLINVINESEYESA